MHRHGSIRGNRDAIQQLFEIGAVVLVVAKGETRRAVLLLGRCLVGIRTRERDRGGILVQFLQLNGKGCAGSA
jgi:hypothetical protein